MPSITPLKTEKVQVVVAVIVVASNRPGGPHVATSSTVVAAISTTIVAAAVAHGLLDRLHDQATQADGAKRVERAVGFHPVEAVLVAVFVLAAIAGVIVADIHLRAQAVKAGAGLDTRDRR